MPPNKKNTIRHEPSAVRGQIALWMLTKFAMVFFIIMLAGIMISFSDAQKESICQTQARSMARNIAATLTNIVNSPVEDERKVFALESSLSVGKTQLERYFINITNIPNKDDPSTTLDESKSGSLVVHVLSGTLCEGYARASYDANMVMVDPVSLLSRWKANTDLQLRPSDIQNRDYYLIIAKCRPKVNGFTNFLYMHQCNAPVGISVDPDTCPPKLGSNETSLSDKLIANPALQCCGWEALETDPTTGVNTVTGGKPLCV